MAGNEHSQNTHSQGSYLDTKTGENSALRGTLASEGRVVNPFGRIDREKVANCEVERRGKQVPGKSQRQDFEAGWLVNNAHSEPKNEDVQREYCQLREILG